MEQNVPAIMLVIQQYKSLDMAINPCVALSYVGSSFCT